MFRAGAGGVVTKSIVAVADTRHCRCSRYGDILFNRDGYSERSPEQWEADLPQLRGQPVIANIVADTPDELAALAARVARAGAEMIELGLSCPTLDEDPICCHPDRLYAFCRAARAAVDVPVIVKLLISTSARGNREMAHIARETRMNGISLADTMPSMLLERPAAMPLLGGPGGASGPFLKPLSVPQIRLRSAWEKLWKRSGGDGFLITTPLLRVSRRYLVEVTDGLVPALQRRGLTRSTYTQQTLRGHLQEF